MFISEAYTLQNNTIIDIQIIYTGGLVVKAKYLCSMQENSYFYWKQQLLQYNIICPTCIIIHPCLDVFIITDIKDIPKTVCNRIQAKTFIQRHHICMTDADYDYILDENEHQDKIKFVQNVSGYRNKE